MEVNNGVSIGIDVAIVLLAGLGLGQLEKIGREKTFPWLFDNYLCCTENITKDKHESQSQKKFGKNNDNDDSKDPPSRNSSRSVDQELMSAGQLDRLRFNFSKQLWGFIWHFSQFVWEFIIVLESSYANATFNPYIDGTHGFWNYKTSSDNSICLSLRVLYLSQIGYYWIGLVRMLLFDRPSDLIMMCIHHIAALILLFISYLPPYCWKIGLAIVLIHEVCDVTLYLAKFLHYASKGNPIKISPNYGTIIFVINIIFWIWQRCIILPRYLYGILFEMPNNRWQKWPAFILLSVLLAFHYYWTFLMIRVIYNAATGKGQLEDRRDVKTDTQISKIDKDIDGTTAIPSQQQRGVKTEKGKEKQEVQEVQPQQAQQAQKLERRPSLIESFIREESEVLVGIGIEPIPPDQDQVQQAIVNV